jgi:hypothetical protein
MLERETADVLDWAFAREGKRGIGQELQWAWQEWQRFEENRSPVKIGTLPRLKRRKLYRDRSAKVFICCPWGDLLHYKKRSRNSFMIA